LLQQKKCSELSDLEWTLKTLSIPMAAYLFFTSPIKPDGSVGASRKFARYLPFLA
jgi:hypothetical protein